VSIATPVVKWLMKLAPAEPPAVDDPRFSQVFSHDSYVNGTDESREAVRAKHSQYRFDYERDIGMFEHFFPDFPLDTLEGSRFLDLGCLTGGRTAAWSERYGFEHAVGFDIDKEYVRAADEFARSRDDNSDFVVSVGEAMPLRDGSFDVVATYDVIEHVADFRQVFDEAHRVLRPGGLFFVVFPTYFQPLASHLQLVTNVRGLLNVFPGDVVAQAYYEVLDERGEDHAWYNLDSPELPGYYKSPFLNGITVRAFRDIAESPDWSIRHWPRRPIFTVGRRAQHPAFKALATGLKPFAKVPVLEEVFLTNVTCVLERT